MPPFSLTLQTRQKKLRRSSSGRNEVRPSHRGALGAWGWALGWRGPRTSPLCGEGLVTCSLALGGCWVKQR